MTRSKAKDDELLIPTIESEYLIEPLLEFASGRRHVDPKTGIARFGPKSYQANHPKIVRMGFVGTPEMIQKAYDWIEKASCRVPGDVERPEFPGFRRDRGYFCELEINSDWNAPIFLNELQALKRTKPSRVRFQSAVDLIDAKLDLLSRKDRPPEYVVLALPDELLAECQTVDYVDAVHGPVHRDLRRSIKAVAMKYRLPTQVLRERTADGRSEDYPSEVAWDFFNALYYKAGGFPWGPVGLPAGSCYIGISFYRPLENTDSRVQTSLVQAFDEHGEGLVLRGQDFLWDADREGTRSPHLTAEQSEWIVETTLRKYQQELGQLPQRVVVHKTSRFWIPELTGFDQVFRRKGIRHDLIALTPDSRIRLFPVNQYPPLRGTRFSVGGLDYLYTTGFLADLQEFHSNHVPSPLQLADHVGRDTPRVALLREILTLTKMNWNSSRMGGLLPITLNFARRVGEILREIPADRDPLTNFKYYM